MSDQVKGISKDHKGWSMQVFNPQAVGVTNGKNVTIDSVDQSLSEFSAFRTVVDTQYMMNGQTVDLPPGMVTACRGNDNITFVGSVVIEVM